MKFCYSPQYSSNSRTQYYFDLEGQRLTVIYRCGEEGFERKNGEYVNAFIAREETRCEIDLRALDNELPKMPIDFVVDRFVDTDSVVNLKLLKQYGYSEKDDFSITFPSWSNVTDSGHDYEIDKTTSLTEFEELVAVWRIQLCEILGQTYNVYVYLNDEYNKLGSQIPPRGSPISIRSFKTSALQNTILYVEAVANFLVSIAIAIDDQVEGAHPKKTTLSEDQRKKLLESDRYMALDEKLIYAIDRINDLLGSTLIIVKGNNSWATFKKLKTTRDSLTHVKIKSLSKYIGLTLDSMLSSVRIMDKDLLDCVKTIFWINNFMDDFFGSQAIGKAYSEQSFNDLIVSSLLELAHSINGQG